MTRPLPALLAVALLGALPFAAASQEPTASGSPLLFHNESLTALWGGDFKVNPPLQHTFTFEHVSGWSWGDVFMFVDQINYNGQKDFSLGKSSYYGEFSPRLSFGKLSGRTLAFGPVKDVLLAATYEFGEGDTEAYLLGPGFDLDIPGFDFFQLNFYYRKPDGHRVPSGAWQITPTWAYTIPAGNSDILIDGFIDWVVDNKRASTRYPGQASYHANLHINPQIKYDLGKALGHEAKHLYVGVEYDYWSDKYGIKDSRVFRTDQNTASVLVKYHF